MGGHDCVKFWSRQRRPALAWLFARGFNSAQGLARASMRVGIVGCGSIGRTVARGLVKFKPVTAVALLDLDPARSRALAALHARYRAVAALPALLRASDFVVEAASQDAARSVGPAAARAGKDVLFMSLGALADDRFWRSLRRLAARSGARFWIPSGALAGLEAVVSAGAGTLEEVTLTTRKPLKGLVGVKYLEERGIDVEGIQKPTVVFQGSARDAVRHFPANVNVAAALSLAGLGFDRTRVEIVADPSLKRNTHLVVARGAFGELRCEVANVPSPDNPRTSYLAALSAVATVKNAALGVHFGP